jgi:hypothetical protein
MALCFKSSWSAERLTHMKRLFLVALILATVAACVAADHNDHDTVVALVQHITRSKSPDADFDSVRAFVQAHSVHRNDDEFNSIRKEGRFAQEVLKHVAGQRSDPVPMICGARAWLMHDLLEEMGFDAMVVHIFDAQTPMSHTFVQVLNPETGKWETQDPDFNIYWIEVTTGARIAVTDYAPDNLDQAKPCGILGCGWEVVAGSNKLKGLFDRVKMDD